MLKFYILTKKSVRFILIGAVLYCATPALVNAQVRNNYQAPQDTVVKKRAPGDPLTTNQTSTRPYVPTQRMILAANAAAEILNDSTKYDINTGAPVDMLFTRDDLEYFSKQGTNTITALFELINKRLSNGYIITFKTGANETVITGTNPLVLKNLRAVIRQQPANINDHPQWKENVYQAYMARDYGTQLHNTITITSSTREIRETPSLTLIDYDDKPITLRTILAQQQAKIKDKYQAEKAAVAEFRNRTFPNSRMSKANANENYKRALFALIDLQQSDLNNHPKTKAFIAQLARDISKGVGSNAVTSLKTNHFYDANVPGNLGPVLLTEDSVMNAEKLKTNASAKAMEITMLVALHYGERDAVKLLTKLVNNEGTALAQQTGDFTAKRLGELTDHGTEKLKSLGFTRDKSANMTNSDLVLMAVAAPETPVNVKPEAFINVQRIDKRNAGAGLGQVINQYTIINQTQETKSVMLFNPRISLGSSHKEYRASFDAVDYVPELLDGVAINQKGARVTQNGIEGRIESDLYFTKSQKIMDKGVKPGVYPEFGVIAGVGNRNVGVDNNLNTVGRQGAVPQFYNFYINWGGHIGLNMGPVLLGLDANFITTTIGQDVNQRFFDLSQGMTYYRYSLLFHVANFGLGKAKQGKGTNLLIDLEGAGETNNSGYVNHGISKGGVTAIGNDEWSRDYNRAHPGGVYNDAVAKTMIANGDVKANYAASNFAALHLSLQKANLSLRGTIGLYNLYTVTGSGLISSTLLSNTINGNVFGEVKLTYNFGSELFAKKHNRKETYQTVNGVVSPHKIEESADDPVTIAGNGPRNHYIFMSKYLRVKPAAKDSTRMVSDSTKVK